MRIVRNLLLTRVSSAALAACAQPNGRPELAFSQPAEAEIKTVNLDELQTLPEPFRKVAVAVYKFEDLTGQNKPNENFSEYSRAVTQGGTSILINALERAGNRKWFTPVERASLPSLLQERQIIRVTREEYGGKDLPALPPMTYAGIMLEGGIIGYDSNTITGGFGARFLGVGANADYRRDTVTVFLRAVSVQSGEVLKSVNVSKTIYSAALQGGAFRFVDFKKLLEVETGITTNEPVTLAVKSAVEKAVYTLVVEGLIDNFWRLKDPAQTQGLINKYWAERDGIYNVQTVKTSPGDLQVSPPPARSPSPDANGEEKLAPPLTPGVPAPTPGPTYIVPGQTPNQGGRIIPPGALRMSTPDERPVAVPQSAQVPTAQPGS